MSSGFSGQSNPFSTQVVSAPSIITTKVLTAQSSIIIEGSRSNYNLIEVNGTLLPYTNYIDNVYWYIGVALTVGINTISVRSFDQVLNVYSDYVTLNVTRVAITNILNKQYRIKINNVDYSNYILNVDIDDDNKLITSKAKISLKGNYINNTNFDLDKNISIEFNDGLIGFQNVFTGKIENLFLNFANASQVTEIEALHNVIDLVDKKSNYYLKAINTGDAIKELCDKLGFTNIRAFNKYKYVGKRQLTEISPMEIINQITLSQGDILDIIDENTVNCIPDEYLSVPLFEFDESQILTLTSEISKAQLRNKINVVFNPYENTSANNNMNESQIIDRLTDVGYNFFSDDYLETEITTIPLSGVIYFAFWNKNKDFETFEEGKLILNLSFDNAIQNRKVQLFGSVVPDKSLVYFEIKLNKLNITTTTKLTFNVLLKFTDDQFIIPEQSLTISNANINENYVIDNFNNLTTDDTLLSSVDEILYPAAVSGDTSLTLTHSKIVEITSVKDSKGLTVYNFIYEVDVTDAVLNSIYFNLDSETPIEAPDRDNGIYYLYNVSMTINEANLFENNKIMAVKFNTPKTSYNRVEKVYIQFKTNPLSINDYVRIKFKLFGKKFKDNGKFVDVNNLKYEYSDATSIAKYGTFDGGYLLNGYLSNVEQTQNLAKKFIAFFKNPINTVNIKLPFIQEIRKNITILITSPNSGIATYYFINSVKKSFDEVTANCIKLATVSIDKIFSNNTITKNLYIRDLQNFNLSPFLNMKKQNSGIERGQILVRHRDGTCDVKIFSTNVKYLRIPSIAGIKPVKNDKVLIAKTIDESKIIIMIYEKEISQYQANNLTELDGTEPIDFESTTIDSTFDPITGDRIESTDTYNQLKINIDHTPKDSLKFNINMQFSSMVDFTELSQRLTLKKQDGSSIYGFYITKINNMTVSIKDIIIPVATKIILTILASETNPMIFGDEKLTSNFTYTIDEIVKFEIKEVIVRGINMYEVVLSHEVSPNLVITNDMFELL
jgi:hypothetical protein